MMIEKASRFESTLKLIMRLLKPLIVLLLLAVCLSGVFNVESDQVAVILRFGCLVGQNPDEQILEPGLHFAFPYVVDEVVKVPVGKIRQVTVKTHSPSTGSIVSDVTRNGYLITGDTNIILVEAVVKYFIDDPLSFALYCKDAEKIIDGVASGVLQRYVSSMNVDTLLTTGKAQLAEDVKLSSQVQLDALQCGVALTNVELTKLTPPSEVKADFDAVTKAAVKKKTLVEQANEYRVNTLPSAQSEAQKTIESARERKTTELAQAETDTAAFNGLYAQYAQNPSMVLEGVLRSRIDALLSRMRVVVLNGNQTPPTVLLP